MKWANLDVYTGDFYENDIKGKGEYTWSDGRKYNGDWNKNLMDGKGICIYKD